MLQLSKSMMDLPVMSLRTGGQVATAHVPIINPNNLKIEGWYCQDRFSKSVLVLLSQDVRDLIQHGLVVNDHDNLVDPKELVRLKEVLDLEFELLGKPVSTVHGKRLGKVSDYAVEVESFYIQKMYLTQSLLSSFSGGNLGIDRSQIVEITQRKIVIQDPLRPVKVRPATAPAPATS